MMICAQPFAGFLSITRILPILAITIGFLSNPSADAQTVAPVIHYASASAGPNQGWEGSATRGAAITIWAKNVGASRGSSFVTVAGIPLTSNSDYAEWGATTNPMTAKGYQRITFWLNSAMQAGDTRGITVTVNGSTSNAAPFTIDNTGRIFFLSQTGSESNNGRYATTIGTGSGPWVNFSLAAAKMRPGDFLYMRGGNWTAIHRDGVQRYSYIGYFESGAGGCVYYQPLINGTNALRITLTSYPGEAATFEQSNIINYSKYWTFTNLRFSNVGANQNLTLGSQWSHCQECSDHSVGLSVIGNEFAGTEHHNIQAFGDDFRIAGNYINVVPVGGGSYGPGTAYSLYLSSGINRLVADNEIHGGAMYGIHAYDEDRESCTDIGRVLQNWTIEGNWIDASDVGAGYRSPMLIGAGNLATVDGITVKNNVLYSNGTASLAGIRIFAGVERNILIHNNTFHGLPSGVLIDYTSRDVISGISVMNNIFSNMVPSTAFPGIAGNHIYNDTGRPAILSVRSNLYDRTPKMVNATDVAPVTADPQYAGASSLDFRLTSTSAAVNAGIALTDIGRDYDGVARPQGGAHDIGAFEFGAGGLTTPSVSVSLTPQTASLGGSQSQQFVATVQNATNGSVTWSLSPAVGSITTSGMYTAPATITTAQTVSVIATSVADSTKFATATVTLNPPAPAVAISVTPGTASLVGGQSQQFLASVQNASNTAVTWSVNPPVGTVSASGLYTAPTSVATQQAVVISAVPAADPTKSASATVTLNAPAPVVSLSVSPASSTLTVNQTLQLVATVSSSTGSSVLWSISPGAGSISASGLYTAPSSISAVQVVTVTASLATDPAIFANATITLTPPAQVITISVSPTSTTLAGGQSRQFSATIAGSTNNGVTWSMSPAVGTLSASGLYTAPATITTAQTVIVTGRSTADPTRLASASVSLTPSSDASSFSLSWAPVSATQVRISWTAPSGRPSGDWISLTGLGSPDWWFPWAQTLGGATSGSFLVTLPTASGIWHFRYHTAGAYTVLATSPDMPINVAQFSVASQRAQTGAPVTLSWTAPTGRPAGSDFVGLFAIGASNTRPIAYKYTGGATSGQFIVPSPAAGTYEARYISGYVAVAVGGRFTQ